MRSEGGNPFSAKAWLNKSEGSPYARHCFCDLLLLVVTLDK